jgi:hypothetical protein
MILPPSERDTGTCPLKSYRKLSRQIDQCYSRGIEIAKCFCTNFEYPAVCNKIPHSGIVFINVVQTITPTGKEI